VYDAVVLDKDGVLVGRTPFDTPGGGRLGRLREPRHRGPGSGPRRRHRHRRRPRYSDGYLRALRARPGRVLAGSRRDRRGRAGRRGSEGAEDPYDDVDALRHLDASLGVVSSNQQATVDAVLDHFGLSGRFEVAYGREPSIASLSRKKPSPYYIERALEDLGAETAIFVGDNESDVLAADNAGIDSAFVRRPHRRSTELSCQPTYGSTTSTTS